MLFTFGFGKYGQLGHGNREDQKVPKLVEFFQKRHVMKAAAGGGLGYSHSIVITDDGNVYSFGSGINDVYFLHF